MFVVSVVIDNVLGDDLRLLMDLLKIQSPAGDEFRMADWLTEWIGYYEPDANILRLRDCLIVTKGEPQVAVFAHIDTNGFTLGHGGELIRIGSPAEPDDELVNVVYDIPYSTVKRGKDDIHTLFLELGSTVKKTRSGTIKRSKKDILTLSGIGAEPGVSLVYAKEAIVDENTIQSPYLDNRAGIWAALQTLLRSKSIAIAFTTGEEVGGSGANICARYLHTEHKITKALISDITWHTEHVKCGKGVALSLRDSFVPSQRFFAQVRELAAKSEIPFQIEIESAGGSDGMGIERSGAPIDWVFVGAPEKRPHTAREELALADLKAMADMLTYLAERL